MSEELYKVNDLYEAVKYNDKLLEENKRLNNIIKEAIEYIEKPISLTYKKDCGKHFKKLLDILKQKKTN